MTRVVFFSFDYDDVWRVNQVRNSGQFSGEQRSGFRDKAEYEQVKRSGDKAIKRWIRQQMHGCSVTCVLIGEDTHKSRWVSFEIEESIRRNMGLVGVYIHELEDQHGTASDLFFDPPNPLDKHEVTVSGIFGPRKEMASDRYQTHKWRPKGGLIFFQQNDLGAWVEEAARLAGRD